MFLGFNLTFFPMHYLGMIGQPRRTHTYNEGHGFETWNQIATIGAFILGVGIVIGIYQFVTAFFNKKLKPAGKIPGMHVLGMGTFLSSKGIQLCTNPYYQSKRSSVGEQLWTPGKPCRKRTSGRPRCTHARSFMVAIGNCTWIIWIGHGYAFSPHHRSKWRISRITRFQSLLDLLQLSG